MAVKSLFFLGVIVTTFLLVSHDTAHARELTEAKEINRNNVQPTIGPGLKDEKWFVHITGPGYGQPGYVVGGGFQPGYGGGLQPGIGGGFQPGFGGGLQPGIGGGFQPGFGGGFQPGIGGGYGFGYGYGVGGINGRRGGFPGGNRIPGY